MFLVSFVLFRYSNLVSRSYFVQYNVINVHMFVIISLINFVIIVLLNFEVIFFFCVFSVENYNLFTTGRHQNDHSILHSGKG